MKYSIERRTKRIQSSCCLSPAIPLPILATSSDSTHFDDLRISGVTDLAREIRSFELIRPTGGELSTFSPGAHVKVKVPIGVVRRYSLCGDPADNTRYTIAVKREEGGQGGSKSLYHDAHVGDLLPTSQPIDNFQFVTGAKRYLFVAGGIGITPILSMVRSVIRTPETPWKLIYLTRSPEDTPFYEELSVLPQVTLHHDFGDPARSFDIWPLFETPDTGNVYCCGPRPLLEAVRDMSGHWSPSNIHFESFDVGGETKPEDKPFLVHLARSDRTLEVPVGETILSVLKQNGYQVSYSCESGTCGTCRTRLLQGDADHRDMVLLPDELETQIMTCVSRAYSDRLVLDL